jgi:glycosyltransferase involved in cell wall biosynthesis
MANKIPKSAEISVVIPVYNEELVIKHSVRRINDVLKSLEVQYEIIVVNDGSTDSTLKVLIEIKRAIENLRIINLPRNLGHMEAITAGYEASVGAYIVTLDADCQDPPEVIVDMYRVITNSIKVDVVQAIRVDRNVDSWFKRNSARVYYWIIKKLTGIAVINNAADFRLVTREVLNLLLKLPEKNKIYRLLIPYLGFRIETVPIIRAKRLAGKSKYSLAKMFRLSIDSIFNFSDAPLKLITRIGFFFSILFLILTLYFLITWILGIKTLVPGWLSIVTLILLSSSLILTSIGVVGEYIGKIYIQNLNRPSTKRNEIIE